MKTMSWLLSLSLVACGGASSSGPGEAEHGADHAAGHPGGHGHHGHGAHHDFSDVERFAAIFDDPERDEWQRPTEVVALLELGDSLVVADLGAGTGYFAPHLSPAVGAQGRVLALDVEEAMVAHMQTRFAEAGFDNTEARVVAPADPGLERASVDRILIVDTWHHISDRAEYGAKLRSALRPGGFVLIVDFTPDSPHGPPPAMRLSAESVLAECEAAGFEARVLEEALPYQYVVRAQLPAP